jgi:hypothetical protein
MLPVTVERLTNDWGTPGLTFWASADIPCARWHRRQMASVETAIIMRLGVMAGRESRRLNASTFRAACLIPLISAPIGTPPRLRVIEEYDGSLASHFRVIYFAEVFDI